MTAATLPGVVERPIEQLHQQPIRESHWRLRRALAWTRLLPVAMILGVQASLSIRLAHSNTAFLDEATYLGAGRQLVDRWSHGGPNMNYETYFSGAPPLYPVLASLVAGAGGGVVAARFLSLGFMLLATTLAYATARRIYNTPAGWFAAAAFMTVEGTQFLGAFATFDSMALTLIALAAWTVARFATSRRAVPHAGLFLAAPVMALANAVKYASLVFDVAIVGMALCLVARRYGWRQGLRVAAMLLALLSALLSALLAMSGPRYLTGVMTTTLVRPKGNTPPEVVRADAVRWIGFIVLMALVAAIVVAFVAWRRGTGQAEVVLMVILLGSSVVAPANQMRIHTSTSLSKHVDFGAWFAAIAAGYLLALVAGRRWRDVWRYPVAIAVLLPLAFAGFHQAQRLYSQWPNSTAFVSRITPLVLSRDGPVLIDNAQVPAYYLGRQVYPTRWVNTFYLKYRDPVKGEDLLGPAAYAAAIRDGYFSVIALNFGAQKSVDAAAAAAIHRNKDYHWVTNVNLHDVYGRSSYVIWEKRGTR
jgi:hypothetical protein